MKSLDPWDPILIDDSNDVIWPRASYGHPFYREVPSWIHYGDDGPRRLLFEGAFIGAESPTQTETSMMKKSPDDSPRKGLLADVAPLVAPATGPITVKKELDGHQVLRVEVCVDGKRYQTSMDLAPAIEMVMAKLAQWHRTQHAAMDQPSAVVGAVEGAIDAAGNAMADTLVCHHVNVSLGGFFDDIGSAIGGTLRKLAPVISTVATKVATYYGGPAAGAAAGQLAPVVTDLHANLLDPKGDPKQKATAQQTLQQVNQLAQASPQAAQALAVAHQAVRDTTVAFHVKEAVDKAIAGDPAAWKDVVAIIQAAEQGDPAARATYEVIAQTLLDKTQQTAWGNQLWQRIMGGGAVTRSAGWSPSPTVVGGFWDDVSNAVLTVTGTKATNQFIHDHGLAPYVQLAAQGVASFYGGPAAGAAAGALAPSVMNLGVSDKSKATAAQQDVQGVTATAQQHSPQMAQAVEVAKGAIQGTATAYHLDHLLKLAKQGNRRAQRALARLQARAAAGDANAQKALQAVSAIHQGQTQAQPTVSGWYDIVGTVIGVGSPTYGTPVASGALLPFLLGAAAGGVGGALWANQGWEHQLLRGAVQGQVISWEGQPIYTPVNPFQS